MNYYQVVFHPYDDRKEYRKLRVELRSQQGKINSKQVKRGL